MRIYLVQHAEAKEAAEDTERGLTLRGSHDARKLMEFLMPLQLNVEVIWHSGKKRARQTAEILSEALHSKKGLRARMDLEPDSPVAPIRAELENAETNIMVVGHMPFLSSLAAAMMVDDESATPVHFQKSGVVCLKKSSQCWQLCWMITPELLL